MERRDRCKWRQKDGRASISRDGELYAVRPAVQQAPQLRPVLLEMRRVPLHRRVISNGIICRYRRACLSFRRNSGLFSLNQWQHRIYS